MAEVDRYRVVLYGASAEKPNLKGKIELYNQQGNALSSIGKIRFHDGALPADEKKKGVLSMNLPSSHLLSVLDVLRNEKPIYFAFHEGRAVLGTGIEPVGTLDTGTPQLVHVVPEAPKPPPKLEEPTHPIEE